MRHKIRMAIDQIFHDSAIAELRLQNNKETQTNLTYNDILYLNIIEAHSGEYTASNIADMLFVSRPAVTQKINELERQGYIYKVQSKQDKRVYKLFTNKEDRSKKYYEIVDQTNEDIVKKLSKHYTNEQIQMYCDMTAEICTVILEETKRE